MPLEPPPAIAREHDVISRRLWHCCIACWLLVVVAIDGRLLFGPQRGSVYPTFARAGHDWLTGSELYDHSEALFRYSPLVAALFAPFTYLPDRLGEIVWRLLNVGVYLAAFAWWGRTCLPSSLTRTQWAWLFLLALPLSVGSLNNGQSNALVLGLLLAASAAVTVERWNLSAALLSLAVMFKIYPMAVALLLVAIYPRRLAWRFALAIGAGLLLPFAMQDPAFVAGEYASWAHYLQGDQRIDVALDGACRDLRLLFRLWDIPVGMMLYQALQLLGAVAVAGICVAGRRAGWPQRRVLTSLLAWGCCWMLLLGPATESCTYILLAPSLAWAVMEAWSDQGSWVPRTFLGFSVALIALALLANWFPFVKAVHTLGPQPLATLCFVGYLACTDGRRLLTRPASETIQAAPVIARAA
jgi:hypothetical protein